MRGSLWCFPVFLFLFLPSLLPCTLAHAADFSLPPQTFTFDGTSYTYSPSSDRFSSPSGLVSPEETRLLKALLHFANPEERVRSLLPMTLHQVRYQAYCFSTGADSDPQGGFFYANQESWEKHRLRVLVLDGAGHPVKDQETLRTLFHAYATGSRFSQPYPYHNADSLDSDRPSPASLLFVQTVSSDLATQLVFADQALAQYFTDLLKGGGRIQVARYEAALQQMLLREETDLSLDLGSEIAYRLHDEGGTYCSLLSEAISAGRYSPHSQVLAKLRGLEQELGRLEKDPAMKAFLISPDAINLIFTLAEKEAYFEERVEALQRISVLLHQRKDANPHLREAIDRVLSQARQTREEEVFRHLSDLLSEYASTEVIGRTQEEILKAIWKGSQPGARTLARHLLASAVAQASLGLSVSNFLWGMDAIYANALNAQSAMEIKRELKRIYDQTYQRKRLQSSYPAEYCQDLTALVSFIRLCNASFYQNLADIAGSSALKTALVDQFANLMGGPTLSGAIEQNLQISAGIEQQLEQELLSPPVIDYAVQLSLLLEAHHFEPEGRPQNKVIQARVRTEISILGAGMTRMGWLDFDCEVSPDGKHLAYVVKQNNHKFVVLDGKEHSHYHYSQYYHWMGFSPDSGRFAFVASVDRGNHGNEFMVVDGNAGKEFGAVCSPVFSPDGKRFAYLVKDKGEFFVILDEKEGRHYEYVDPCSLTFSPDSGKLAYAVRERKATWFVVVNEKEHKRYQGIEERGRISNLAFSPNSKRLAYVVRLDDYKHFLVVDEMEGKRYVLIDNVRFSPNSEHIVFTCISPKREKYITVLDGKEGKEFDSIRHPFFTAEPQSLVYEADDGMYGKYNRAVLVRNGEEQTSREGCLIPFQNRFGYDDGIPLSSDMKRIAYKLSEAGKFYLIVDGEKTGPYDQIYDFSFSPDAKRFAIAARDRDKGFVLVDGKQGREYDGIGGQDYRNFKGGSLVFSPDSKRVAYVAQKDGKNFVVFDGNEGKRYDRILEGSLTFSPDSARLTYVAIKDNQQFMVVDESEGKRYDKIVGPRTMTVLESSLVFRYIAEDGGELYLVEERLN